MDPETLLTGFYGPIWMVDSPSALPTTAWELRVPLPGKIENVCHACTWPSREMLNSSLRILICLSQEEPKNHLIRQVSSDK